METGTSFVGQRVLRLEDGRLLRGKGRFVDDVDLPGQLWLRVVRSPVAHARVRGVDVSAALARPGVRAALTGDEVRDVEPIPLRIPFPPELGLDRYLQPVLARDRVRYVGEPVAVVVAESPYAAEDAAELVELDLDELPVVLDAVAGLEASAVQLRGEGSPNEVISITRGYGDVDAAFAAAAHVVSAELKTGRHTGVPMETRGLVADWDAGRRQLTIHGATLVTHYHRRVLSRLLGLPLAQITYRSTDSGGSFGVRGDFFPEDFLVAFLARRLERPVKWVEDRQEHLVSTNHAREQLHHVEAAFDAEGTLLALRDEIWHDKGAYIRPTGIIVADITLGILPGGFRLPAYRATIHAVTTNKTPIGPYRGPGRYQTTFARERILDLGAAAVGVSPAEIRARNLLSPADIPWEPGHEYHGMPLHIDSGDFSGQFAKSLEAAGFDAWVAEAERLRAQGRLVGNGIGCWIDKAGLGGYETGGVQVDPSGRVRLLIGGSSTGQGIETAMAQLAAGTLGVTPADIDVVYGDSDLVPDGIGSWSSRSTVFGGNAIRMAAEKTADQARRVAGELLEAAPGDLVLSGGRVHMAGSPDRGVTLGEVAAACDSLSSARRGDELGLGARCVYADDSLTYPYGVNLVQVELDPATGGLEIRRCCFSVEAGLAVNPLLVEGQASGGIAQGLGGALLELLDFDESGQPRSSTFVDYLVPSAMEVPTVQTLITEDAPSPSNPLGAKGMGEAGIVGMGAALANAVCDALGRPDAIDALPMLPETLRALAAAARAGAAA